MRGERRGLLVEEPAGALRHRWPHDTELSHSAFIPPSSSDASAADAPAAPSPWVLLYARGAVGVPASSVRVSLRRARALAQPDRLWIVGGPTAVLATLEGLGASRVVATTARGALPLLPVLLELGRLGGADVLCVLAPDDLCVPRERELRRSVAAALDAASRTPRASLLIGLADDGVAGDGLPRLMPAPATDGDVARPLLAMLAVPVGPRGHRSAQREVLRDSGVVVGRVSSLLALYKDFLPGAFLPLVRAWLTGETERTLAALPEASLQHDLLPRALRRLRVVGPSARIGRREVNET